MLDAHHLFDLPYLQEMRDFPDHTTELRRIFVYHPLVQSLDPQGLKGLLLPLLPSNRALYLTYFYPLSHALTSRIGKSLAPVSLPVQGNYEL